MFVDQQLSEEARMRAESAAAAKAQQQQATAAAPVGLPPSQASAAPQLIRAQFRDDTQLVPNRADLDEALEAAREERARQEDAVALEMLNPHTPVHEGWRRGWALTKVCLAVLTIFPARLALLVVTFALMTLVATVVMLLGCISCRCSSSSLSVRPKNCLQRTVLRLLSPLCRLVLFSLGFVYIRERRTENDGHTRRLRRRCWQCRPSRRAQSAAAGAAAIATAVASRSGSKFRPGASTSTPQRPPLPGEYAADTSRHRIDAVAAAHGATIIANHSSIADPLYIGWRYPATAVGSDFFKLFPCFWVIAKAIGVLFISGHRKPGNSGTGVTDQIVQYQQAAATERGHHLRRLLVMSEGTTTNGRQILQFRCDVDSLWRCLPSCLLLHQPAAAPTVDLLTA